MKGDLEEHGYTAGCPGCEASNRGLSHAKHSAACRARFENIMREKGDERIEMQEKRMRMREEREKQEGALWWKKTITRWCRCNEEGGYNAFHRVGKFSYSDRTPYLPCFDSLEEAQEVIKQIIKTKEPKYHSIK